MHLFATVFGVIFVAELPDKTALAALVLATRYRALPVFLGACLALSVQSAIAVGAGALFAKLPPHIVHVGCGLVFVVCGVFMWRRKQEDDPDAAHNQPPDASAVGFWRALGTVFVVVFVAEWGDLTQIGTAAFAAKYHAWAIVFLASSAALWVVTGVAVCVGNRAARLLDARRLQRIAALVFVSVGVVLIVT